VLHDEIYGIACFPATEAFIDPFGRGDREGRCFLIVERTKADHVHPSSFEGDKITDYLLNTGGGYYVFYGFTGDQGNIDVLSEGMKNLPNGIFSYL
jgi:hypothetical protein